MLFRVRRDDFIWNGIRYMKGEILDIPENHDRIRPLVEQSHVLEYANVDMPEEAQGTPVGTVQEREIIVVHNPSLATTDPRGPAVTILNEP